MSKFHYPKTRSEWLALRALYVSSTESAALFGMSPYLTAFELWHQKHSKDTSAIDMNERMEWGLVMERTIAKMVSLKYGVKVRNLSAYVVHDATRMGASFDYEIVGIELPAGENGEAPPAIEDTILQDLYNKHGAGCLEIKNVDWMVFKEQWSTGSGEGETPQAPEHIEVQVQHQQECIDREWTAIAALVGGNRLFMIPRLRDREVGAALVRRITEFWKTVEDGTAPSPILPADAEFIGKLYGYSEVGKLIDLRGNSAITALCDDYKAVAEAATKADENKKSAKAELLLAIGDAEKVLVDGYKISAGMIADAEIPAYTRKGYRNVRITKEKIK